MVITQKGDIFELTRPPQDDYYTCSLIHRSADVCKCTLTLHTLSDVRRIPEYGALVIMSSVSVLLVISTTCMLLGINVNPVRGQGFSLIGGNAPSQRILQSPRQPRSSALIDILLINSLSDLDADVDLEAPVFFNPVQTGSVIFETFPRTTPSRTKNEKKKKKTSNNSYHNGGSSSLASLFCAYCVQFGFNLCVSRYCFVDLFR